MLLSSLHIYDSDLLRSRSSSDSTASTRSDLHRARDLGYTPLSAVALAAQSADVNAHGRYWENEEQKRYQRLLKASRELGFELPRHCY